MIEINCIDLEGLSCQLKMSSYEEMTFLEALESSKEN